MAKLIYAIKLHHSPGRDWPTYTNTLTHTHTRRDCPIPIATLPSPFPRANSSKSKCEFTFKSHLTRPAPAPAPLMTASRSPLQWSQLTPSAPPPSLAIRQLLRQQAANEVTKYSKHSKPIFVANFSTLVAPKRMSRFDPWQEESFPASPLSLLLQLGQPFAAKLVEFYPISKPSSMNVAQFSSNFKRK